MVNQQLITMKQPELGKVIQQRRLSKGMTQEELVERCNINVRTIQRIEAGEVTPRAYTVRTIMEVLEIPMSIETEEKKDSSIPPLFSYQDKRQLWWTGLAGIAYFILSSFEIFWNMAMMSGEEVQQPEYFVTLKVAVLITYAGFAYGFWLLGKRAGNQVLQLGAVFLILVNAVMIGVDIYYGKVVASEDIWIGVFEVVAFGISLIPFSLGLIMSKKQLGQPYLVVGALGLVNALIFITVILVLIGVLTGAAFDIACIYLLFQQSQKQKEENFVEAAVL